MKPSITARIDNITRIPEEYRNTVLPAPKAVKIELTARCDLQCFFCATGMRLRKVGDIDFEFLCKILTDMRQSGVEEIGMFYLGESFLYPKLADAIWYAKHRCGFPYVFLTTNGRMATEEKIYECVKAGLDSLKFSFNSGSREQFKETTKVDGFDKVVAHIKSARTAVDKVEKETGHKCGVYASSILYYDDQRDRMQKAIDEITPFVDEHYFLPLYGQAGLTAGVRGTKPVAGNIGRIGALRDSLPCWAVFTEGHVTYDGKLSACCFDHDGRFDMGDLNQMPFMAAWNSEKFQTLRAANLKKDVTGTACEMCIAYAGPKKQVTQISK